MSNVADLPAGQPFTNLAQGERKWPHPPSAPAWMVWTPYAAVLWAIAYGLVRCWWTIRGGPSSGPLHVDLIVFTGWASVGLCASAATIVLILRMARWNWGLLIAAWALIAAHLLACMILLLDLVGGLLPGLGVAFNPMAFLSRAACLVEGILVGAVATAYRRRWRSVCLFCGRTRTRAQITRPPRWAWWAAYAAIAGCLARLGAQMVLGFGMTARPAGTTEFRFAIERFVFEAAFLFAGTVLPLSLVHSWGRRFPPWVPLLLDRRVPRWLPLGPAFVISALMTVYFGFTLAVVSARTFSGGLHQTLGSFPLIFFWVAVPAYLVWGVGLGLAAIGYFQVTRPQCSKCGRGIESEARLSMSGFAPWKEHNEKHESFK